MTPFCLSSSLHLLLSPSAHHWFFLPFLASSSSPDSWCEWRRTKKRTRKRTTTSSPQLLFILLQSEVSVCWCKQIRDSHRVFLNTKTYLADVKSRVMNHTATLNFSTHTSTTSFHVVFLCFSCNRQTSSSTSPIHTNIFPTSHPFYGYITTHQE